VLELDRAAAAGDQFLQRGIALRLHEGPPGKLMAEHVEIVGHDQVDLAVGPVGSGQRLRHQSWPEKARD